MEFLGRWAVNLAVLWGLASLPTPPLRLVAPAGGIWFFVALAGIGLVFTVLQSVLDGLGGFFAAPLMLASRRLADAHRIAAGMVFEILATVVKITLSGALALWLMGVMTHWIGTAGVEVGGLVAVLASALAVAVARVVASEVADIPSKDTYFHLYPIMVAEAREAPAPDLHHEAPRESPVARLAQAPKVAASLVRGRWRLFVALRAERRGDTEVAITEYGRAIEASTWHANTLLTARMMLVETYREAGRIKEAIPLLREVVESSTLQPRFVMAGTGILAAELRAEALGMLAEAQAQVDDHDAAIRSRLELADAARDAGSIDQMFVALIQAAQDQSELGQIRAAIGTCERALAEAEQRANTKGRALALAPLARLRAHLGDVEAAEALCAEAVALSEQIHDAYLVTQNRWLAAFLKVRNGKPTEAERDLDLAIAQLRDEPDQAERLARYEQDRAALAAALEDEHYWEHAR